MLRANVPAIYVYGGTILPGRLNGKDLNIVSVFEAVGENAAGRMSDKELKQIELHAIPGPGSCGGMYMANTMRSEEHTSELQSLMRISYAVFCLKKKTT